MFTAHLCLVRRDRPDCVVEIELIPFRMAKFGRADHDMKKQLEGRQRYRMALIAIDDPK
jgi:hypothetical protein